MKLYYSLLYLTKLEIIDSGFEGIQISPLNLHYLKETAVFFRS